MVNKFVVEAEADIEPEVIAHVVVPEIDDDYIDEVEEPEMDPKEPDQIDEDIDTAALGPAPAVDIAYIVAI